MTCKSDLWCAYCGTQEFGEIPNSRHPDDSRYSTWECVHCGAIFEDNPDYGYFTAFWGNNDRCSRGRYSPNTGELIDDSKLPRTPEGILRHSSSEEELQSYLDRTQIK